MPTTTAPAPIGHELVRMAGGPLDGADVVVRRGSEEWLHISDAAEHLYRRVESPWRIFRYMGGAVKIRKAA